MVSNILYFHPYLGKIPILTNIFQVGWNHQLVLVMSISTLRTCIPVNGLLNVKNASSICGTLNIFLKRKPDLSRNNVETGFSLNLSPVFSTSCFPWRNFELPGGEIPTRVCWQRNIVWPHYLKTNVRRRPKIWWRSRPEWLGELGVGSWEATKRWIKRSSVENWFNNWCSLTTYLSQVSKKKVWSETHIGVV